MRMVPAYTGTTRKHFTVGTFFFTNYFVVIIYVPEVRDDAFLLLRIPSTHLGMARETWFFQTRYLLMSRFFVQFATMQNKQILAWAGGIRGSQAFFKDK